MRKIDLNDMPSPDCVVVLADNDTDIAVLHSRLSGVCGVTRIGGRTFATFPQAPTASQLAQAATLTVSIG
jgi:hypothetical protein